MTWDYWMDLQVWKERSTALRKIKGTQARKIDLFQKFFIFGFFCLAVFIVSFRKGKFDPLYGLFLFVIYVPVLLLAIYLNRSGRRKAVKAQLPAYHCVTVKNGILTEELTTREGTITRGEKPLTELIEAVPFRGGLYLRFNGPVFLFFPQAAFRQTTPQQSAAFIRASAASARNMIPESAAPFPEDAQDHPAYGTLYFELPKSHVYDLYRSCNLHIFRHPKQLFYNFFSRTGGLLLLLGVLVLLLIVLNSGYIFSVFFGICLFFAVYYALLILTFLIGCGQLEKKDRLSALCGPQQISFYEDRLHLKRQQNSQQIFYREIRNLYEARDAYYLLYKKTSHILMIPKWAFTTPEEETMFVRTLRKNILHASKR